MAAILAAILVFKKEIEITKKQRKLEIVNASHVKYYIIKHFAAFCEQFVPFSPKKREKHTVLPRNGLTTCYL